MRTLRGQASRPRASPNPPRRSLTPQCWARSRLAVWTWHCSLVALDYARKQAETTDGLIVDYRLGDYRMLDVVEAFDVALLIYYDFGVLVDAERDDVLRRVARAVRPGGRLVFDVLTPGALGRRVGQPTWSLCPNGGFWRADAYLAVTASYHYPALAAELDQIVVLDTTGLAHVYRNWNRGYTPESLAPVLERTGFRIASSWGDLEGSAYGSTDALGIVAVRQ